MLSNLDLEPLLYEILVAARELTGARYAALGVLDPEKKELERFLTVGVDAETRADIGLPPKGHGILGRLIADPRPLRLENMDADPGASGSPGAHPAMKSFLGVPIVARGEVFGNLYLTEKAGGAFTETDETSVVVLAGWAAIAIENARLYRDAVKRGKEAEHAVEGMEASTDIALALGGEADFPRVLELIADRGRSLVDARALSILLLEHGELKAAAGAGDSPGWTVGGAIGIEGTLPGRVFRSGLPETVSGPFAIGDFGEDLTGDVGTAILVPLKFRTMRLGVIVGFDRVTDGPCFLPSDVRILCGFAASAATAVRTARSVRDHLLRSSIEASENERRRWARELHDETLQGLGMLRIVLSAALRTGDSERVVSAASDAVGRLEIEIDSLRGLIAELRPAALDEIGLVSALDGLIDRMSRVADFAIESEIEVDEGLGRLPAEVEEVVYRVVQESLNNSAKHSGASCVGVEVAVTSDRVDVTVRDDGVGFDARSMGEGLGLLGIRERANLVCGDAEVLSEPGRGTVVRVSIPLTCRAGAEWMRVATAA